MPSSISALLSAAAAAVLVVFAAGEGSGAIPQAALTEDDECKAQGADGRCSLNALQLRSLSGSSQGSADAVLATGDAAVGAFRRLHADLHGLVVTTSGAAEEPGSTTAAPMGTCDNDLMQKVYTCMTPLITECPKYTDECIMKHVMSLCSCRDSIDQLVAQCEEAKASLGPLQQILPMLCSPCGSALTGLRENMKTCLKEEGDHRVVNEDNACSTTCKPHLCSVLTSCTESALPGMNATEAAQMKEKITAGTAACPCSS